MFRIITAFFIYLLKSFPVAAVVATVLFFAMPKPELLDYQVSMPSEQGRHVLEMNKGFTRVTVGADGNVYVLDRLYCNEHNRSEVFVRPVGYWSVEDEVTISPNSGSEELLD